MPELSPGQQERRGYYEAKPHKALALLNAVESLEAENAYLREGIDICIDYLDVLMRTTNTAKYTCDLCGAGPDVDHLDSCEFTAARERLHRHSAARLLAPEKGQS